MRVCTSIEGRKLRHTSGTSRVMVLWPNICTGSWVSHICTSLCEGMARHGADVRMYCQTLEKGFRSPIAYPSVPPALTRLAWRLDRIRRFIPERTIHRYLNDVAGADVCWLWPCDNPDVARELRRRGHTTIMEAINCHQATTRRLLDAEYRRLGWPSQHSLTDARIAGENQLYELASYVFAPSPRVADSLLENGIPESKILRSSYGWSPHRFPEAGAGGNSGRGDLAMLFAGTVCVRKGPHLLAAAWRDARVQGRLRFAGRIATEFGGERRAILAGQGIELLGHRDDIPALMQCSDAFAFPTLEEAGPLVTYEAAAMGLAIITTPMGAGEIIRDGIDGIVIDPHDHDAWVQAIRRLSADPDLRARLGTAARQRAHGFTWDRVAKRRLDAIVDTRTRKDPQLGATG